MTTFFMTEYEITDVERHVGTTLGNRSTLLVWLNVCPLPRTLPFLVSSPIRSSFLFKTSAIIVDQLLAPGHLCCSFNQFPGRSNASYKWHLVCKGPSLTKYQQPKLGNSSGSSSEAPIASEVYAPSAASCLAMKTASTLTSALETQGTNANVTR